MEDLAPYLIEPPCESPEPSNWSKKYGSRRATDENVPLVPPMTPEAGRQVPRVAQSILPASAPTVSTSTMELKKWIRGVQERADRDARRASKVGEMRGMPRLHTPPSPDAEIKTEARAILKAVTTVEAQAEGIQERRMGRIPAREFLNKVKANRGSYRVKAPSVVSPSPPKPPKLSSRIPQITLEDVDPTPPVAPVPRPHPGPSAATHRAAKKARAAAKAELARAHETAVKIAVQRRRRRTLRRCLKGIVDFVHSERERLRGFMEVLTVAADERVLSRIVRVWHLHVVKQTSAIEAITTRTILRVLRGRFSLWISSMASTTAVLETFKRGADWRWKSRVFGRLRKYAIMSSRSRRAAREEMERARLATLWHKAVSWHSTNAASVAFSAWSGYVEGEVEKRKRMKTARSRGKRVRELLGRVREKVEEVEAAEATESSDDDAQEEASDKVSQLRSLIDECIDERLIVTPRTDSYPPALDDSSVSSGTPPKTAATPASVAAPSAPSSDVSTITRTTSASHATPRSVVSMFKRHSERAARRAALSARYSALDKERGKRKSELESKREAREREEAERYKREKAAEEKRRQDEIEKKKVDLERRREMHRLAVMHYKISLVRRCLSRWLHLREALRLKEVKADRFADDCALGRYWLLLKEYVRVRKELKADLEARALRKADEYYYDGLVWKVFSAWGKRMKKLLAMEAAVRGQSKFGRRRVIFALWRKALDKERIVWWEMAKHASSMGKFSNKRHAFRRLVEGCDATRLKRIEDEKVARKMEEVRGWLTKCT